MTDSTFIHYLQVSYSGPGPFHWHVLPGDAQYSIMQIIPCTACSQCSGREHWPAQSVIPRARDHRLQQSLLMLGLGMGGMGGSSKFSFNSSSVLPTVCRSLATYEWRSIGTWLPSAGFGLTSWPACRGRTWTTRPIRSPGLQNMQITARRCILIWI
jgi:hypothetical protein